ncbi:MAG TPA: hypothetical protein VNZ52_15405 [Candidatus Thermoplasmatota archaeon]|nr:hypothetical protein [Candidatus Thermoplasmatota archaeon]
MTRAARPLCPECATPLVPTLRGLACPKLSACGRGGIEERGRAPRSVAGTREGAKV